MFSKDRLFARARNSVSALTGRPRPSTRVAPEGPWRTLILTSIHDIDPARWDAIVGKSAVTRSHAYLAAIEAADAGDCRFFYPVVFNRRNEIVAHACVYLIRTDFAQLLPAFCAPLVRLVRRGWRNFLTARVTECASPLVAGSSISVAPGVAYPELAARLADATLDIAWAERSSLVLVRDFETGQAEALSPLLARGFNRVSNMPLARLELDWGSHTDYLAALKPRYRRDVLRRLRRGSAAGLVVRAKADYGAEAERWAAQVAEVQAKGSRFVRERIAPAYYRALEAGLGGASRLFVAERNGVAVAHGMVISDHENTIATFFGREAGEPAQEWFLLMDAVIRYAIERGSQRLHLGLGAYEAKALVGAGLIPLTIFCRSRHGWVNWLMRRLPDVVNTPPQRLPRVFSSDPNG